MSWSCRLECEVLQKVRYINTLRPTRCYLYFYIAGCKNSIRHSENRFSPYFIIFVLMQFRLWRAAAFVSSPIHVFRLATSWRSAATVYVSRTGLKLHEQIMAFALQVSSHLQVRVFILRFRHHMRHFRFRISFSDKSLISLTFAVCHPWWCNAARIKCQR